MVKGITQLPLSREELLAALDKAREFQRNLSASVHFRISQAFRMLHGQLKENRLTTVLWKMRCCYDKWIETENTRLINKT